MIASKAFNTSHAAILGTIAGVAYAFVMCGLANLLSTSMMSTVVLAFVVGGAIGAGTLGGIAALLNHVEAFSRSRDERLAKASMALLPGIFYQGAGN